MFGEYRRLTAEKKTFCDGEAKAKAVDVYYMHISTQTPPLDILKTHVNSCSARQTASFLPNFSQEISFQFIKRQKTLLLSSPSTCS